MSDTENLIELIALSAKWQDNLGRFLYDLEKNGDSAFFSPHAIDTESIGKLIKTTQKDLYYLLVEGHNVLGYGLLRGWDEGYKIPSLGLATHPSIRGKGFGKLLMNFLHLAALRRGCSKIRLRVENTNITAISMYKSYGYVFEEDTMRSNYLVGFKILQEVMV